MRDFLGMESGPGTDWSYERLMDDNTRLRSVNAGLVEAAKVMLTYFNDPDGGNPEYTIAIIRAALARANIQKTEG